MAKRKEQVEVIRRTIYKVEHPAWQTSINGHGRTLESQVDEVCCFDNKEHRKAILSIMAGKIYEQSDWDDNALNAFVEEVKEVIEELKKECPFN